MVGTIIGIGATIGAAVNTKKKKKEKEEYEEQLEETEDELRYYQREASRHRAVVRPVQVVKEVKAVTKTKVINRNPNSKKVEFYDLYREIDNYFGRLVGTNQGGGTNMMLNGYRLAGKTGNHYQKWMVLKAYRNKRSHDKSKWINVVNPNPDVMNFMRQCYQDMKLNPNKYRTLMRSGMLKETNKTKQISKKTVAQIGYNGNKKNRQFNHKNNNMDYGYSAWARSTRELYEC